MSATCWGCPRCTFENPLRCARCQLCRCFRPAAALTKAVNTVAHGKDDALLEGVQGRGIERAVERRVQEETAARAKAVAREAERAEVRWQ